MTYGLGLLLDEGVILMADTRTNAGVDHIAVVGKLNLFQLEGSHILCLASAGNLATTQAVVTLLNQRLGAAGNPSNLFEAQTMFDAARMVGNVLREVMDHDARHVSSYGDASASMLLGGQIVGNTHRLFLIYSAGNFIEAGDDTPYLQLGELKYGKPILDRAARRDLSLSEALKIGLLSFDATIRSNLSVAPPIDVFCYKGGTLAPVQPGRVTDGHPFFEELKKGYADAIRQAVAALPPAPIERFQ